MRVLLITRKFPPSVGGMERFAFDLYQELKAQVEVELVAYGSSNANKLGSLFGWILPSFLVRGCWRLLTKRIDVIHMQDGVLAPLGWLLSRLFRKPFVVVVHGLDITYRNPLFKRVIPRMVGRADVVFCISQAAALEAMARGVSQERVRVIPLGIADQYYGNAKPGALRNRLQLPADSKVLITVGRLVKRKGVAWFVREVLPGVVQAHPEVLYLVAGEGAERPAVEQAAADAGLARHVRLLGRVDDELLTALYNQAAVFVMPNVIVPGDMEGFGLVSLEAALCELSVVASGIEGIRDAIQNGKNGVLVPSEDAAAFQWEIDRFISDGPAARRFGKQARQFTLRTYSWPQVATRYVQEYRRLLGG